MDDFELLDSGSFDVPAKPTRYPFLNRLNLDLDVTSRLSLHLDRLRAGDSTILTSALSKDNDPNDVLDSWNKIFESKLALMNQPLINLEMGNKAKYGPRSICKPWKERIPSIEAYYADKDYKLPYDVYSGSKLTKPGRLRPLSYSSAVKFLKNNTNSGLPYYTRKARIKERLIQRTEFLLQRRDPCILFTRTQEGDKTRDVWGYPAVDTLEEVRYYRPLLDHQKRLSWRSALVGPDEVSKMVTMMLLRSQANNHRILSGDISKFDASVCHELIVASFYYIKQLFQSEFRSGLDRIMDRFSSIELLTPDGVVSGVHGVPSGSTFTNEVDSIVQYLVVKSLGFDDNSIQIQGDDLLLSFPEDKFRIVVNRFRDSSLPINEEKSYFERDWCVYLQNLYHIDYIKNGVIGGIYPTYRALCRIMFQERWSNFEDFEIGGIDYYSIRTISILENCKHHPLFRELVEFVYKLDKYSLRFSKASVSKYDAYLNNSGGIGGFLNNQYGDDVRGINSFETVKIIRSLNR